MTLGRCLCHVADQRVSWYIPYTACLYRTWKEWENNIHEDSTFEEVVSHTNIIDLWEYMNLLNECPKVTQSIIMTWDMDNNSIQWKKIKTQNHIIKQTLSTPPLPQYDVKPYKMNKDSIANSSDNHTTTIEVIGDTKNVDNNNTTPIIQDLFKHQVTQLSENFRIFATYVETKMELYKEQMQNIQNDVTTLSAYCKKSIGKAHSKMNYD